MSQTLETKCNYHDVYWSPGIWNQTLQSKHRHTGAQKQFSYMYGFFLPPFKFIFASEEKLDSTLSNSQLLPKFSIMSFDVFIVTIPRCVKSLPFAVRLSIFTNRRLSCNPPNTSLLGYSAAIWQSASLFDFKSVLSNTSQSQLCRTGQPVEAARFTRLKQKGGGGGWRERKGKKQSLSFNRCKAKTKYFPVGGCWAEICQIHFTSQLSLYWHLITARCLEATPRTSQNAGKK